MIAWWLLGSNGYAKTIAIWGAPIVLAPTLGKFTWWGSLHGLCRFPLSMCCIGSFVKTPYRSHRSTAKDNINTVIPKQYLPHLHVLIQLCILFQHSMNADHWLTISHHSRGMAMGPMALGDLVGQERWSRCCASWWSISIAGSQWLMTGQL